LKVLSTFKSLFTLSDANYIFITDQEFYNKIANSKRELEINATLFSHSIFLTDPTYYELTEYLNQISESVITDKETIEVQNLKDKKEFNDINNYLIYESQFDYFALKKMLNDTMQYSTEKAIIDTTILYEESSDFYVRLKSAVMQIFAQIDSIYRYRKLSNLNKNQNNLMIIFDFLKKWFYQSYSYDIKKEIITLVGKTNEIGEAIIIHDTKEKHLLGLLDSLSRYDILKYDGIEQPKGYTWTGKIPNKINTTVKDLFPKEKEFLEEITYFINTVNDIDDISEGRETKRYKQIFKEHDPAVLIGFSAYAVYAKHQQVVEKLQKKIPEHVIFDNLVTFKNEVEGYAKQLKDNYLKIGSGILAKKFSDKGYNVAQIPANANLLNTTQELKQNVSGIPHYVVFSTDYSKQIVFLSNLKLSQQISSSGLKIIKEQEKTIFIVKIVLNKEELGDKLLFEYQINNGKDKDGNDKYKTIKDEVNNNYLEFVFDGNFRLVNDIFEKLTNLIEN
jgi:hypothetical protein